MTAASALAAQLEAAVDAHWAQGRQVVIVGGDHSISYGALKAALRRSPELGILHLDAHADLRRAYEGVTSSHASIMDRVKALSPSTPITPRSACAISAAPSGRASHPTTPSSPFSMRRSSTNSSWACPGLSKRVPSSRRSPRRSGSRSMSMRSTRAYARTQARQSRGLTYYQAVDLLDRVQKSGRTLLGVDLTDRGDPYDALIGARLVYRALAAFESNKRAHRNRCAPFE